DFRQTVPVNRQSTTTNEINACLKYSALWRHVKTLKLAINMHFQLQKIDLTSIAGNWERRDDD
ncbi:unnamed protein product, partial [Onchocerca ochengi]